MDNSDITINGSVATWNLPPTQGEVLGTYSGNFEFRCYLTPSQMLEAGREFRALLGNFAHQASETESNIAFAIAQLRFRIIKGPPFWESTKQNSSYAGDIPDLNILALILDRAIESENLFKINIQKERDLILERTIQAGEALLIKQSKGES